MHKPQRDILYLEGPGDIVAVYETWRTRGDFNRETSITASGQVFDFCNSGHHSVCAVSYCARRAAIVDEQYTVMNLPRQNIKLPKIGYALTLFLYSVRLLLLALRIKPKVILINSGVIGWEFLPVLKLSGAKLVPVMHNALWPEGYKPHHAIATFIQRCHGLVWRRCVWLTMAASPAVERQVQSLTTNTPLSIIPFRPNFPVDSFKSVPKPRAFFDRPFRIMYAGRIEENKGVFDLLAIARSLNESAAGKFEFVFCGEGNELMSLQERIRALGLTDTVKTLGKLNRSDLIAQYLESHIVIVPTRSTFAEGYAMVVAEAILLLRPVITSRVVPSAEVLKEAVVLANTDDIQSYAAAIHTISLDDRLYQRLVDSAVRLRKDLLDDTCSFRYALTSINLAITSK
jgi:glycosyltransferase involved in cell wall biosynthesis